MTDWRPTLATLVVMAVVLSFCVATVADIIGWTLSVTVNVTSSVRPEAEKAEFRVGNYTAVLAEPRQQTLRTVTDATRTLFVPVANLLASPEGLLVLLVIGVILLAYEVRWRREE